MIRIKDRFGEGNCKRLDHCNTLCKSFIKPESKYINYTEPPTKWDSAIIDLNQYADGSYVQAQKKRYGGNIFRAARKAERLGYYCQMINFKLWVPDIVEINHSMFDRQRGPMKGHYNDTIDEKGGYPTGYYRFAFPPCPSHYKILFGVLKEKRGHKQGDIVVNEKVCGYISLFRVGNVALYSMILGHGDHLKNGIMYLLHLDILEFLLSRWNNFSRGVDYLMYTAMNSGTRGLQQWKRVCLFEPKQLFYRGQYGNS